MARWRGVRRVVLSHTSTHARHVASGLPVRTDRARQVGSGLQGRKVEDRRPWRVGPSAFAPDVFRPIDPPRTRPVRRRPSGPARMKAYLAISRAVLRGGRSSRRLKDAHDAEGGRGPMSVPSVPLGPLPPGDGLGPCCCPLLSPRPSPLVPHARSASSGVQALGGRRGGVWAGSRECRAARGSPLGPPSLARHPKAVSCSVGRQTFGTPLFPSKPAGREANASASRAGPTGLQINRELVWRPPLPPWK